jgi:hypothetical protein
MTPTGVVSEATEPGDTLMANVWVYKDSDDEYRVYPPVVVLRKNDDLEIGNTTDEDLEWSTSQDALNPASGKVGSGKKEKAGKARDQKKKYSAYSYTVTMTLTIGTKKKAKGNSDPVIIIEM